jgi:hypothetical protein
LFRAVDIFPPFCSCPLLIHLRRVCGRGGREKKNGIEAVGSRSFRFSFWGGPSPSLAQVAIARENERTILRGIAYGSSYQAIVSYWGDVSSLIRFQMEKAVDNS